MYGNLIVFAVEIAHVRGFPELFFDGDRSVLVISVSVVNICNIQHFSLYSGLCKVCRGNHDVGDVPVRLELRNGLGEQSCFFDMEVRPRVFRFETLGDLFDDFGTVTAFKHADIERVGVFDYAAACRSARKARNRCERREQCCRDFYEFFHFSFSFFVVLRGFMNNQPFIPPLMSILIKYFWKHANTTTTGTMLSVTAARRSG